MKAVVVILLSCLLVVAQSFAATSRSCVAQRPGATMQMNVVMSTGGPLRYQWMFNGTNLPSQNNATLMIGDLQPMLVRWS